jgi:hypothetical protein
MAKKLVPFKKPRKKLTPAQRKAIWAPPQSNAGLGWWTGEPTDPIQFIEGK